MSGARSASTRVAAVVIVGGMRVLCSFVGGAGHFIPQLPILRALVDAGHELTLIGRASAARSAPEGLFRRVVTRPDRRTELSHEISSLAPLDIEAELSVVANHFAGAAARQSAAEVEAELADVDLVVCDELDFGAMAAGGRAGVPVVVVSVIASGALVRADRISDALERLRAELGLSQPIRYQGDLFVVPFAPTMRDPRFPAPEDAVWMRPDSGPEPEPDGSIVATLGTEFNSESGDLFDRILAAIGELDFPAVVAVGRDLDPARFGSQPSHVHVEQHVDLGALVPRASVVLHHGGSGMFLQSVLGGAPQIVFPMGADQPFTAERVQQLGVGRVLDPFTASPVTIRDAIAEIHADEATRSRVLDLRAETLTLPEPSAVIHHLEALVRRGT